MNRSPLTVAIATFNSERYLAQVLTAIRAQNEYGPRLELLIIDGGSTDSTKEIAKTFNARVIQNPRVEPVYAKYLAFQQAKSDIIMYLDHDEVLMNANSVRARLEALEQNPQIAAALVSGYKSPDELPFVNRYINEFGDPFSFFMYRLSKSHHIFVREMRKRYPFISTLDHDLYFFLKKTQLPLIELCAAATIISRKKVTEVYQREITPEDIPHFFYKLQEQGYGIAIHRDDPILHFSSDVIPSYLAKIRWRIKNNIFRTTTLGKSGFSGRQAYMPGWLRIKKFLYPLYAFSLVGPVVDAAWLMITRKDVFYFWHVFFTLFTAWKILQYTALKLLGQNFPLTSYDEKKSV